MCRTTRAIAACHRDGPKAASTAGQGPRLLQLHAQGVSQILACDLELQRGVVAVKDLVREQQFEVARTELAETLRVELEQARALSGR